MVKETFLKFSVAALLQRSEQRGGEGGGAGAHGAIL